MPTRDIDFAVASSFGLEFQGQIAGYFLECSGLGSEHEIIETKVVDERGRDMILKQPGRMTWQNISLKRGISSKMDVWEWRAQVENGDVEGARRNGSIVMYDQSFNAIARWNFVRAWPSKVTGPQLGSDNSAIGMEEIEIVHEGLTRVAV